MSSENILAELNEWHFFKEFTYSCSKVSPGATSEIELADNIISVGRMLYLFQLKDRNASHAKDANSERKWFEKKVVKLATQQVRQTLAHLAGKEGLWITNQRGHKRLLKGDDHDVTHAVVIYVPSALIPKECFYLKHHLSKSAGFIHLFPAQEYETVLQTLLTPAEVSSYLSFRRLAIENFQEQATSVSEADLLGQYLAGAVSKSPSEQFRISFDALKHHAEDWDISGILSKFPDRIIDGPTDQQYYEIVETLAVLTRGELKQFKIRVQRALADARAEKSATPYRMASMRTDCAFIFVPIVTAEIQRRTNLLVAYTELNKYQLRRSKGLGVAISKAHGQTFDVQWCLLKGDWQEDARVDDFLKHNSVFRDTFVAPLDRYQFQTDEVAPPDPTSPS